MDNFEFLRTCMYLKLTDYTTYDQSVARAKAHMDIWCKDCTHPTIDELYVHDRDYDSEYEMEVCFQSLIEAFIRAGGLIDVWFPSTLCPNGFTPLQLAVETNKPWAVKVLLGAGALPCTTLMGTERSPLVMAAKAGNREILKCLMEAEKDYNLEPYIELAIERASEFESVDHINIIRGLLERKPSLTGKAIRTAIQFGNWSNVSRLVRQSSRSNSNANMRIDERGLDSNVINGGVPLLVAKRVNAKFAPSSPNSAPDYHSALVHAIRAGEYGELCNLLESRVDATLTVKNRRCIMDMAVQTGVDPTRILLEYAFGPYLNVQSLNRHTQRVQSEILSLFFGVGNTIPVVAWIEWFGLPDKTLNDMIMWACTDKAIAYKVVGVHQLVIDHILSTYSPLLIVNHCNGVLSFDRETGSVISCTDKKGVNALVRALQSDQPEIVDWICGEYGLEILNGMETNVSIGAKTKVGLNLQQAAQFVSSMRCIRILLGHKITICLANVCKFLIDSRIVGRLDHPSRKRCMEIATLMFAQSKFMCNHDGVASFKALFESAIVNLDVEIVDFVLTAIRRHQCENFLLDDTYDMQTKLSVLRSNKDFCEIANRIEKEVGIELVSRSMTRNAIKTAIETVKREAEDEKRERKEEARRQQQIAMERLRQQALAREQEERRRAELQEAERKREIAEKKRLQKEEKEREALKAAESAKFKAEQEALIKRLKELNTRAADIAFKNREARIKRGERAEHALRREEEVAKQKAKPPLAVRPPTIGTIQRLEKGKAPVDSLRGYAGSEVGSVAPSLASVATNAVPVPPTTKHGERRVDERLSSIMSPEQIELEIQWSLKHGSVTNGGPGKVVHRGRPGGVDVVTTTGEYDGEIIIISVWPAKSGNHMATASKLSDFVCVEIEAKPKKPCRNGPNCKFGDSCWFGHDVQCSKAEEPKMEVLEMVYEEPANAGENTDETFVISHPPTTLPDNLCLSCLDGARRMLAVPCGHLCVCKKCHLELSKCPHCEMDAQMWVEVKPT